MHPMLQRGEAEDGDRYAWIITHDLLFDPKQPELGESEVGTAGPRGATEAELAKAKRGRAFAMYDDDGTLYYRGRIWTQVEPGTETDFAPLYDFGTPNAGCTEIRYNGKTL